MNQINAVVSKIQSIDNLSILSFKAGECQLRMMALEVPLLLDEGSKVTLGAKASNIAIGKNISGQISISNQLPCIIKSINKGALVCSLKLDFQGIILESIISVDSFEVMDLVEGENALALIKSSELSIL